MIAILAIFVGTLIASSRLLRLVFESIDVFAYVGLFVACWVGAGGALVPVPGVRPISWFMVIQQGAALNPILVAAVAAIAMVLGQSSYFLAARAAVRRHARGTTGGDPPFSESAGPETTRTDEGETDEAATDEAATDEAASESSTGARSSLTRMKDRVTRRVQEHATSTAFLVSALPSPLTTIATTASASAGTTYPRWVVPAFLGYLLFAAILAIVGQGLLPVIRALLS